MKKRPLNWISVLIVVAVALSLHACMQKPAAPALKDLVGDRVIGAALNYWQVTGHDSLAAPIVETQFNTITPENLLKWGPVHPQPDKYNFAPADSFVSYGERHNMFIVGHVLVWHAQTPRWVFRDEKNNLLPADVLDKRMKEHIQQVMGRYKGRIHAWDVVNEALNDDGTLRNSDWFKILGKDFIAKAFKYAHETDPDAELYYNDYTIWKPEKRQGVINIVKDLKALGIQIDGIGMQGHYGLDWPDLDEFEKSIVEYSKIVDKVMITELDLNILPVAWDHVGADISKSFELNAQLNPWVDGLPDSMQQKLSDRYRDLFEIMQRHKDSVKRITFWGVTDERSWLNNFPVRGRTAYPMLWDRQGNAKPAFDAVVKVLSEE